MYEYHASFLLYEKEISYKNTRLKTSEEMVKIVARIPVSVKEEIRLYIKDNKGMTESALVLKGLTKLGFKIDQHLIIDKRTIR